MDVTPVIPKGKQIITGYGNGAFMVNGVRQEGSHIIFPTHIVAWDVRSITDVNVLLIERVATVEPRVEILLIGTGEKLVMVSPELRQQFKQQGISIEVMDTGAACRTYNVLLSEERRVAAALIAV